MAAAFCSDSALRNTCTYQFSGTNSFANQNAALNACKTKFGAQSTPVTPGDSTVNAAVFNLCDTHRFFDMRRRASMCNQWESLTGIPITFLMFDAGEPSNGGAPCNEALVENCVGYKYQNGNANWHDASCTPGSSSNTFVAQCVVCDVPPPPTPPSTASTTTTTTTTTTTITTTAATSVRQSTAPTLTVTFASVSSNSTTEPNSTSVGDSAPELDSSSTARLEDTSSIAAPALDGAMIGGIVGGVLAVLLICLIVFGVVWVRARTATPQAKTESSGRSSNIPSANYHPTPRSDVMSVSESESGHYVDIADRQKYQATKMTPVLRSVAVPASEGHYTEMEKQQDHYSTLRKEQQDHYSTLQKGKQDHYSTLQV